MHARERVEERVKSNEAAKGTRGSQRTSKGRNRGGDTAGTRRAQHRTETPERGAPGDQGKSSTTHHDTHGTGTTHTAHTQRTPATHPAVGGQTGEGQRLTPSAPHHGGRHPPRGRLSATPTASNAGPQGRTLWGRCRAPTPTPTAPGTRGSRNPGCTLRRTGSRGRDSAWHQAPLTTVEGSPPRGRPSATPTASNAGPQGRTLWGRCWVHTPASTAPGTTRVAEPCCTLRKTSGRGRDSAWHQAPLTTVEGSPPGDALPPPPQRATPARKGARCGADAGSTRPHRPHPGHTGRGTLAARSGGRAAGGGAAPDTRRPSQRWKAPPPGRPSATPQRARRPARRTLWGRCWVHTPASTAPGTHGSRNPGCALRRTSSRGRDSA